MKVESNIMLTIAVSGTLTIAREDLESLLKGLMVQERGAESRDSQPIVEATPPKAPTKDFGPSPRLAYSMRETADILGVSYITGYRLIQRGLLRSSLALRRKMISKVEIKRFLKETSRAIY
jgi:hypothetical protein